MLRRARGLVSIPGLVLVLGGCATVGPDYEEPATDWRAEWQADLYEQIGTENSGSELDLEFWWHLFDDPVLNDLIELVRRENPSMRIAGLKVLEARAALGIARGYQWPQVQQLVGDAFYQGAMPDDGDYADDTVSSVGFNAGWEIDFWGKFRRGVESADAAFFASVANQQNFQVLLSAQVAELYYSYRATLIRAEIARRSAEIQKRSYEITQLLNAGGEESELDLQQAKSQYMSTLSTIPGFELSAHQIRNAICALAGQPPGALPELDAEFDALPYVDPVVVEEIPAQLLIRRPDIRAAAAGVAAQTAQIGASKANLFPSVSLLGTVGYSGSTLSLGVGPSLTWDIFNYGRIKNDVRVQDARLQQAIEEFQDVALQAAREIDDAAIAIVKTREQREPQRESTRAAERSLEIATARYHEGYSEFQSVLEAQRSAATQSDRELVNQSQHISAIISFYKAIGGGWRTASMDDLVPRDVREAMDERTDWGDLLELESTGSRDGGEAEGGKDHE